MSVVDEPLHFGPPPVEVPAARVMLVGAGPGDPDLLTVKADRAIRQATLVLYDHLVADEVLALLSPRAERICVGKRAGCHSYDQQSIIDLMLSLALSGRPLLRLKGGDPYIFGRGGEEAQALAAAGVPFEVIPGISSAQAASAAAGMPLTHRDHASSVVLTTGHLRDDGDGPDRDVDWPMLARGKQTVVFYMGLGRLAKICARLIAHGLAADTPAATIERASRPDQRIVTATLATLPDVARAHGVEPPALIVVGGVVGLHRSLAAAPVSAVRRNTG